MHAAPLAQTGPAVTGIYGTIQGVAAESTNERSSAIGRWYLAQLDNGCGLEDAAFLDLQIQEHPGGTSVATGLVVFQQPEMELYQRLVEASRNRLAELELEYDSTASELEGKRELNADETARLKQLWKKLVRMFHPDRHEQDEQVIDRIAAAQREELEQEIAALEKEARAREEEIEELVGASPF